MPPLRKISGKKCLKILCNKFGFQTVRQKGSHVLLIKREGIKKIGAVVPLHNVLKIGTLKSILHQAEISEDAFSEYV